MSTEVLFRTYRTQLFSLAYRMLGSVMDAEDIVQEAFLTYDQLPDPSSIQNERAYLYKIVTNRCLDLLRSSAKKRELYVGPWLPEPLLNRETPEDDPSAVYLQHESISTAYLLLLQQLNTVERAVFLLREIFHYSYDEIAEMVGKSSANCRQIFRRAQSSIHFEPDETPSISIEESHIKEFVTSLALGNTSRLLELVSDNVVFLSDGGGKVHAARIPVAGLDKVLALFNNLIQTYAGKFTMSYCMVNGMPGLHFRMDDQVQYIYSFRYKNNRIDTIYAVSNPDKLRHV
ncbi:RNA polymerase sigma-70 factor (ECF subfamily) [Paenibacillus cellulosilyticus]|uniref:RNA polymerase sigma-70 factor (ECF subfamily) n=1 Tax=Paenibacillus cellulosilyticus TaxID=375489 RepID=A0A2V2YVU2_9BACL|nr:RNA polymerase sigma-70 factor [Paenibacillus cellulosilyticus]PWW04744.1 RNA polymerase sigma-70 factor (ECF subfamily) [Paenibacillus cellulosilyticus]QKS45869.1 RNA polymerase sigma-70 factor [Paenibacillus cellulosilyticus]